MFCALSDQGLIKLHGIDAQKFLQGQLTCDVAAITADHSSMGAHCNPQGRVISLFYLFLFQDAYYLLMQREMIPIALSALKKYAVFFKVEITDASEKWLTIGIQNIDTNSFNLQNLVCIPVSDQRYIIAGEVNAIKNLQHDLVKQTENITLDYWKYLGILDGIPTLYPETSSKFLPHEINLQNLNAISLAKGCYTGQEIIARMHYRGKLKNHMCNAFVSSEFIPQLGTDVYTLDGAEWKVSGMVVDLAHQAYNQKYYFLMIANESNNSPLFLTQDLESVLTMQW